MSRQRRNPSLLRLTLAAAALIVSASTAPAQSAGGASPEVEARIRRVESGLVTQNVVRGETPAPLTIQERMRFYRVPAVSVAVINNGRIEWARAWGEAEAGSGTPADTATLFQAASISKPVAAIAALRLVEQGRLSLDEDVNARLASWRVPENEHTATEKVTLRRLLSHSAGTTVHGFPGYEAGDTVPTVVQILDGQAPANTNPVRVDTVPGGRWRYSGGGYTIAQLLMTDVTGQPFADLMRDQVLRPAGMIHSTYAQPLPADRAGRAATAHSGAGTPIDGKYHTYPEQAAAGLWTTPSDLARLLIEVQRAYGGETGRVISPGTARQMLTVQSGVYGLGFSLSGRADTLVFGHGGSNAGFRGFAAAVAGSGRGVVVMTNGDNGNDLGMEIVRSVAREYALPLARPDVRDAIAMDAAELAAFVGTYARPVTQGQQPVTMTLRLEGGVLRADVPAAGWQGRTIRPSAPDTFFFLESPGTLTFERDASGAVTALAVNGVGQPMRLVRQ
jgi:CubicO group peptidase (beta-lactamase class C family)